MPSANLNGHTHTNGQNEWGRIPSCRDDAPAAQPDAQCPAPDASPIRLPAHVDLNCLLIQRLRGELTAVEIAANHDIDLNHYIAWTAQPHIRRQFAKLRAEERRRIRDARPYAELAALCSLTETCRAHLFREEPLLSPSNVRATEVALAAARSILFPPRGSLRLPWPFRRKPTGPRPTRSRSRSPRNTEDQHALNNFSRALTHVRANHSTAPDTSNGAHLPPSPRASGERWPREARSVRGSSPYKASPARPALDFTERATSPKASLNESPTGSSEVAGPGAKRSERQARNLARLLHLDPEGVVEAPVTQIAPSEGQRNARSNASADSRTGETPVPPSSGPPSPRDLFHRAGALPRAP